MNPAKMLLIMALVITIVKGEPEEDKLSQIPGYPTTFTNRAYAGYLSTDSDSRKLHYVFLESSQGASNSAPVMLWLNGGPGCSSKIGFIQELSPYCINAFQPYSAQDNLTPNPYSWSNLTNLLFLDSPAGVGFSINTDPNYTFNDANTAKDNLLALKDFFSNKFPQYANNTFYLAGESYAGKYVPDLAIRILSDSANKIPLKGVLLGNPILSPSTLQENRIQWMLSHNLIDPQLKSYWEKSCKVDAESAGCQYFYERFEDQTYRIDEYNIYGECYGRSGPPQSAFAAQIAIQNSPFNKIARKVNLLTTKQYCAYSKGVEDYLNINAQQLNSKNPNTVQVCNSTIYDSYKVDPKGSLESIPALLKANLKLFIYTGDWDSVVPFTDTLKNILSLNLRQQGSMLPWLVGQQHAGFTRTFSYNLTLYHVKGAGHEVPLYQRQRAYKVVEKFIYT